MSNKNPLNKHTLDKARDIVISKGLIPNFQEYHNNSQKLEMLTVDGYKVVGTIQHLQDGKFPSVFGRGNPYTAFNIKRYLKLNNIEYKLLEDVVRNSSDFLQWECPNGHKFKMQWKTFQSGKRCAECAGNKKKTILQFKKQFYELAKGEYELLSDYSGDDKHIKIKHISCGREYYVTPSHFIRGRRCRPCGRPRGIDNNKYNPSLDENDRVKRRIAYGESIVRWRTNIYKRDNFTCKICGTKGAHLNAHHLDGYNWCKEKRFDIENGVTLCKKCHKKFHKIYGMGDNTKKQFEDFLNDTAQQYSASK